MRNSPHPHTLSRRHQPATYTTMTAASHAPTLTVRRQRTDTHFLLHLVGTIDILTLPILDRHIAKTLWSDPPPTLIIDLTYVDFLSSAGMQILLETQDLASPQTRLAIITTPHLKRLLDTLGITNTITTYPSLDHALS